MDGVTEDLRVKWTIAVSRGDLSRFADRYGISNQVGGADRRLVVT